MQIGERRIDVELTNRCNALCSFCPREETPQQGFMSLDTFKQVVARVKELDILPCISLTGQGESTLHPELEEFVRYAKSEGMEVQMTTNGNLLSREKSIALLDAGLDGVCFSCSDMDEDYELVYNLDFERTRSNILDFLEIADKVTGREVEIMLSIVIHDLNRSKLSNITKYWKKAGIKTILRFEQNNRGGACDNGHYFSESDQYETEARELLAQNKASTLCPAPYYFIFLGWNGQYYICCSDYKKTSPLGSVFDYSIDEMDMIKMNAFADRLPACVACNFDPVNVVREKMFEIAAGESDQSELDKTIHEFIIPNHVYLPGEIDILNWEDSLIHK